MEAIKWLRDQLGSLLSSSYQSPSFFGSDLFSFLSRRRDLQGILDLFYGILSFLLGYALEVLGVYRLPIGLELVLYSFLQ